MGYLLFERTKEITPQLKENIRVEIFKPKLFKLYSKYEQSRSFRISLFRLYTFILTQGKVKVYFALGENDKILHSAYIIPKNLKHAFLKKDEANIGPCNTVAEARGKGLYPYMVDYIVKDNSSQKCYLLIREENVASIRGALKAGFEVIDRKVTQTKLLKRFIPVKERKK